MNSDNDKNLYLGPGLGYITQKDLERLIAFHGFLTTGAFIGLQMLALGKRLLNIKEDDRIHVECETINCVPDVFQVMAGTTVGNKGLMIKDTGKLAVTITKHSPPGQNTKGIRIILDPNKTQEFDKLHAWYMNTGKFSHDQIIPILAEAGERVYSYKYVDIPVPHKPNKQVILCSVCGEAFVASSQDQIRCAECT